MDIVWTARHASNPPRAATFLSTIAAAERLAGEGDVSPAAASETANASEVQTDNVFRNMDASSFEEWKPGTEKDRAKPAQLTLRGVKFPPGQGWPRPPGGKR